ncbi:MAG: type II toxin-antitoxin system VapC family toxin [Cytophagaceae bacterium]|nr:type II toxin-antitoxin system VapC family toxin [Cytophagaceae bacterium]
MYLLDMNLIVDLFKGRYQINERLNRIGRGNCQISEITVIELRVGAELSQRHEHHLQLIETIIQDVRVIPITGTIEFFAQEKACLQRLGTRIPDFDLLIQRRSSMVGSWSPTTPLIFHASPVFNSQTGRNKFRN